jgi:hypothetical protein
MAEARSDAVTGDGSTTNGQYHIPLAIPPPPPPVPGISVLLQVLHNFEARTPDELTLRKGEHIELLQKDGRN